MNKEKWGLPSRASIILCLAGSAVAWAQSGAPGDTWPHYGGDHGSTKYAPLDQIHEGNFEDLEIVWRWESIDTDLSKKGSARPWKFRNTPIMCGGVLYVSTGLHQVAALDAGSGETLWTFDTRASRAGAITHGWWQHRGLEFWTDGREERVLLATGARELFSIDARTGRPDPGFGENGRIDLSKNLGRDVNPGSISHTAPVIVVADTVIVGSIIMDFPIRNANPPGHVRGYDVRTGTFKWRFNTIPQEGEYGAETWENDSWKLAGNTNVWSMMSGDDELGYVYLPTSTPTSDYYGGHRRGDNLFAESLVCLNADTGELVWHFQAVHHGLWDYDFPCAPNLVDITVDGRDIKAVAQVSKQGFCYVFDRITGEPVWPIEERPVPKTNVPGEKTSPTQPFPTKPPAFESQGVTEGDVIDFTPELRAEAMKILEDYAIGPLYSPPTLAGDGGKNGTLANPGPEGGANWPGASVDPETGMLYVQSHTMPTVLGLEKTNPEVTDFRYRVVFNQILHPLKGPRGLPLLKPPYRRITAIDLNRGVHVWQIPVGDGPREHPAIKHLNLGELGSPFPEGVFAEGGILLTRTLLITFLADLDEFGDRRARGTFLRAYDKATGEFLASRHVERSLHGSPMTYMHEGRQYIVISGGGHEEPSELLAFALPEKPAVSLD